MNEEDEIPTLFVMYTYTYHVHVCTYVHVPITDLHTHVHSYMLEYTIIAKRISVRQLIRDVQLKCMKVRMYMGLDFCHT